MTTTTPPIRTIVLDLFDGTEELDLVGPWEVLAHWCATHPDDGWRVVVAADDLRPRTCAKGLVLTPQVTWADLLQPDVIIEPGGRGSRARLRDECHLARLREAHAAGAIVASVCTGALVLAAADLLVGRPATTHHEALNELAELTPDTSIRAHERWVDDGDIVTAAGVSAGIDMALHLVHRLAGRQRARDVRHGIAYFPHLSSE